MANRMERLLRRFSASKFLNLYNRHKNRGTVSITIILFVFFFSLNRIIESSEADMGRLIGIPISIIYFILIIICIISFAAFFYLYRFELEEKNILPDHSEIRVGEDIERYEINDVKKMREIQEDLFPHLFGDLSAPPEEIYKACENNRYLAVGIYSKDLSKPVGFARIYPLKPEFAEKMIAGEIGEIDLTSDDIISEDEIGTTKYIYIEAVGVLDGHLSIGKYRGVRLINTFKRLILERYMTKENSITLFAITITKDGEKWCRAAGMRSQNMVHFGEKLYPLYLRRVTWGDIWNFGV